VKGLSPGETYIYRVSSHNSVNGQEGVFSDALIINFITEPAPPTLLQEQVELKENQEVKKPREKGTVFM